jgi:hypothetical protein
MQNLAFPSPFRSSKNVIFSAHGVVENPTFMAFFDKNIFFICESISRNLLCKYYYILSPSFCQRSRDRRENNGGPSSTNRRIACFVGCLCGDNDTADGPASGVCTDRRTAPNVPESQPEMGR